MASIQGKMERLLSAAKSPQVGCCTTVPEDWEALTKKARRRFDNLPADLQEYLLTSVPKSAPKISLSMLPLEELQKSIEVDETFIHALRRGYLPLAHRDANYACCHLETGSVDQIGAYWFAEGELEIEKSYKSIGSWLTAMRRKESGGMGRKARRLRDLERMETDPQAQDSSGRTKLWWSVSKRDVDRVRLEIERGADVNLKVRGESVLHFAIRKRNLEVFRLLLEAGARTDQKYEDGTVRSMAEFYFGGAPEALALCDRFNAP